MKTYQYYAGGVWRVAENGRTFDDMEPFSGKISEASLSNILIREELFFHQ